MKKPKILFIGDYKEKGIPELLDAFVGRYSECYDILVTGYNFSYISRSVLDRKIHFEMNSSRFIYFRDTAEYTVVTTQAPRYFKRKNNQTLIYVLLDFDVNHFAGCMAEINEIITDSSSVEESIATRFDHIHVKKIGSCTPETIIDAMDIEEDPPADKEDFLIVTSNRKEDALKDRNGLYHLFNSVKEDSGNNIIICSEKRNEKCATTFLELKAQLEPLSVLKEFDGTILIEDEYSKSYFDELISKNDIKLKTDNIRRFSDFQLKVLEDAAAKSKTIEFGSEDSEYVKYRKLMEALYNINNCAESKVSFIICRYNTPMDFVNRAVGSVLNSGHENVEILIIDDGSRDNVEKQLAETFNDNRIKYFHKENEGLGLSRNYGIRKATGKYIFFLDADDTISRDGLRCLVSHADFYDLDMVRGIRILCDDKGVPQIESQKYLAGDTFTCYYADNSENEIYSDVMVTNSLIRRQRINDAGIWFTPGLYEDVEYSAKLYANIPEFHYINVPIYWWYQYGDNTTISSTVTIRNLEERLTKQARAWIDYPEVARSRRLETILLTDLNLYLYSFYSFPEKDQLLAFEKIRKFVLERKEYLSVDKYAQNIKELTQAFTVDNFEYFKYVIDKYYGTEGDQAEPYDDYVVFTHYHLYVACLYALKNKRKCRLFICQSYIPFDTNLIYKIRQTGIFDLVKPFVYGGIVVNLFEELRKRPGEDDIIIPHFLYSRFKDVFKECNTKIDTIYIFSDSLPYWYYIEREFDHIVKLEDAYNSFDREVKTHEIQGIWAGIQKYEGTTYPLMFFRSDKINKIIVSSRPEQIPEFYYDKIEIDDTKLVEQEYHDEIRKFLLQIYDVDPGQFSPDATLLLTQPLALFGYCSENDQRKLMKKMLATYKSGRVLIKPHPADKMDYSYLGGTILPKNVPIEVYNYLDVEISRAITFGSSAIETITIAKEKKAFFKLHDFEYEEVGKAIKEIIKEVPVSRSKKIKRKIKKIKRKIKKTLMLK